MIYRVVLTASHERCTFKGYYQNYDAYDQEGNWRGGVGKDASCFSKMASEEGSEEFTIVFDRDVEASTPYQACRKLEEWQKNGKPESWLTEVTA